MLLKIQVKIKKQILIPGVEAKDPDQEAVEDGKEANNDTSRRVSAVNQEQRC